MILFDSGFTSLRSRSCCSFSHGCGFGSGYAYGYGCGIGHNEPVEGTSGDGYGCSSDDGVFPPYDYVGDGYVGVEGTTDRANGGSRKKEYGYGLMCTVKPLMMVATRGLMKGFDDAGV